MLGSLVTLVALVLIGANAFAVKAADGGHGYKLYYHLGIMMAITGAIMLAVPTVAGMIFGGIATLSE